MIYFDHNATTPLDPRVLEAMRPFLERFHGNPSSLYRSGRIARSAVETAREQVAALVNAHPSEVIFTSGGTEANNLALKGFAASRPPGILAIGATEHPSVLEIPAGLPHWQVRFIEVDGNGLIQPEQLEALISQDLRLASIMWANNETGVIQAIPQLADRLRHHDIPLHSDAVQAAGKIPVDFKASGLRLMSLSGHKIYGPKGVGALLASPSIPLHPLIHGGGQEKGLRAGTENVAAIVGFGKAAELAAAELEQRMRHCRRLRDRLEAGLSEIEGLTIFARTTERLSNTVLFGIRGIDGEMLLMQLDRLGVAASSGSACASGAREPSHVLTAMGVAPELAISAVRISLGQANTEAEVDQFLLKLKELIPSR